MEHGSWQPDGMSWGEIKNKYLKQVSVLFLLSVLAVLLMFGSLLSFVVTIVAYHCGGALVLLCYVLASKLWFNSFHSI